jgi:phenylalanyl-tRNA synthetase beta chain
VIADDQAVESLAGIMGGDATAVSDDTRQRLCRSRLLVARGRGRAWPPLQLQHRCRPPLRARCRPGGTVEHIEHITRLILDICGTPETAWARSTTSSRRCRSTPRHAAGGARGQGDRHAGDAGAVRRRCSSAWAWPSPRGDGTLTVTPPSWRFDLVIEEDLIEEVARVIGYQKLPTTPRWRR